MLGDLPGKVAIVTGAGQGIGEGIATVSAAAGARVVVAPLGGEAELAAMARCIPQGHMGVPEDIANTMLFLASKEARYITGQTIVVDGGSTLPESLVVMDGFYD